MGEKIRIGAFVSGGGTNLQAVIDSCESGKIDGKMVFVGSDNPDAKGLVRGKKHGIPAFAVDYVRIIRDFKEKRENVELPCDFDLNNIFAKQSFLQKEFSDEKVKTFLMTRAIAEKKLLYEMRPYPFDLLILAGFMRHLTPYFIDRVNTVPAKPRIMNIHPALLPAFPGTDGYGDTYRYGCRVGGCTVHFIDYNEDSGPIIDQRAFKIQEDDTIDTIKEKGLKLEWELYPECIQSFGQGRLKVVDMSYLTGHGNKIRRTVVKRIQPD